MPLVRVLREAGGASGGPQGADALPDPGKPMRSSTAPKLCQGHWAWSGAACPNSGFCSAVHKTVPTWDYDAGSERVAHPDGEEAWGGWSHLAPCPWARRTWLWEQSKQRAWEGDLTSTGAPGAEGHARFPRACPTCCCSPLRTRQRLPAGLKAGTRTGHPAEAVAGGRALPPATGKHPSRLPPGSSRGCGVSELLAMVVSAVGLQSHRQRHGSCARHAKLPKPEEQTVICLLFFSSPLTLPGDVFSAQGCR